MKTLITICPLLILLLLEGAVPALAQTVSGKVVSQGENAGIPGVNVTLKGGTTGTVTDAGGNYAIPAPGDGTLVFSYIGFATQEVRIDGRQSVDVTMSPDVKALSEVVVVGYGTQRRKDVTGAIASVSEAQIRAVPVTNINQTLQGRAAGVLVSQGDMRPGGGLRVRIRGVSSINSGVEPIYVVDGMILQGTINDLNPNDIESVDVLKDASAAAIYGARGANGVVIITTKRGKAGQLNVNYDTWFGFQDIIKRLPMMNAGQYAQLRRDAEANVAAQAGRAPRPDEQLFTELERTTLTNGESYDWQDALLQRGSVQNHSLTLAGGSENTRFYVSGNYLNQQGIIIHSKFQRLGLRVNLDQKMNEKLRFGTSLNLSRTTENVVGGPTGNALGGSSTATGIFYNALSASPLFPFTNPDGTYPLQVLPGSQAHPIANAKLITDQRPGNRLVGTLFGVYTLVPGLDLRTSVSVDVFGRQRNYYAPRTVLAGASVNGYALIENETWRDWLWENTLTYNKTLGEKHNFTALAGFSMQRRRNEYNSASAQGFSNDILTYKNLSAGSVRNAPQSLFTQWSLSSWIGRLNYGFADKYLLTLTGRVDGSSRFGPENKYGFFPSGSVAWRFSEENFLKSLGLFSNGKLRVSYGALGNQDIALYRSFTQFSSNNANNYSFNNTVGTGIVNTDQFLGNPAIKWESAVQFNAGVDLGLWGDRLSLTADYFVTNNEDLLQNRPLPVTSGYLNTLYNIGAVRNSGVELSLNGVILDGPFRWDASANWSAYKNEITSLVGDVNEIINGNEILRVGEPLGARYDYLYGGVWQEGENIIRPGGVAGVPGDMKIVDVSGDGKIDAADQTIVGRTQPKWFGGFTNNFAYKGFSLNAFFNFVYGNDVVNRVWDFYMDGRGTVINNLTDMERRWTPENPSDIPRATIDFRHYNNSSRYMDDGSFLRLRTLTLAYDLPAAATRAIRLKSLRVYTTAQNLFTVTNYRGFDPESDPSGFGTDVYPGSKMYLLGLNVGF
jgi:TonB-linked SusC/RagA family outer membrane protein